MPEPRKPGLRIEKLRKYLGRFSKKHDYGRWRALTLTALAKYGPYNSLSGEKRRDFRTLFLEFHRLLFQAPTPKNFGPVKAELENFIRENDIAPNLHTLTKRVNALIEAVDDV